MTGLLKDLLALGQTEGRQDHIPGGKRNMGKGMEEPGGRYICTIFFIVKRGIIPSTTVIVIAQHRDYS